MPHRVFLHIIAASIVLGGGGEAFAQPPQPKVELWGGLAVAGLSASTTLTTSYAPVLRFFTSTGRAGQAIELNGGRAIGVELGMSYFPVERAGLQVLVGYDSHDLSGPSGPYAVHLEYSAMFPPSYTPTPVVIDRAERWSNAEGAIRQLSVSVNGVGRWRLGGRLNGELSGGLSYFRMQGEVRPVGYSTFQLGGHSVLFSDLYELALAVERTSSFGFNLGGAADLRVNQRLGFTADVRYFNGRTLSASLVASEVLNAEEIVQLESLSTIRNTLHPQPLELAPARARIMAGLKVLF
jgi:hypothetical protein